MLVNLRSMLRTDKRCAFYSYNLSDLHELIHEQVLRREKRLNQRENGDNWITFTISMPYKSCYPFLALSCCHQREILIAISGNGFVVAVELAQTRKPLNLPGEFLYRAP